MANEGVINQIQEFLCEGNIDTGWLIRHTEVEFEDISRTVIITIDNICDQEYGWLKDEVTHG
jgi:hypothetical protein